MATSLREHFRHPPERLLADCGKGAVFKNNAFRMRIAFAASCADWLISDKSADPSALFAGWRLEALWLDDLERLIELTEKDWNGGKLIPKRDEPPRETEMRNIAFLARREYELYFTTA